MLWRAFVVLVLATNASAQIALVQTVGTAGSQAVGTTLTVTVPAAGVAVDDTLLVAVAIDPAAGPVSCTDTAGNTYDVDADVQRGSGTAGVRTIVLSALVTSPLGSGDTITITHPSVAARAASVYEFAGISLVDRIATATGSGTNPSSGSTAATSQDDELLFGAIAMEAKKTDPFTPGPGYTGLIPEQSGSGGLSTSNVAINAEYRVVAAAGAYSAGGTINAYDWAAALATYRAVACGNGVAEPGEQCDDGNLESGDCCDPDCQFEDESVVCRDAAGDCDLPETCAGDSASCPPDDKSTDECRPAVDDCDVAESCDGISDDCPPDAFEEAEVVCRDAAGDCDLPETCDGESEACPPDEKSSEECRPADGGCDVAESCDGVSDDCPVDTSMPDVDDDGVCDPEDYCPAAPDDFGSDQDYDGIGDACDPCTNLVPVFVQKPQLKLRALRTGGGSKFKWTGIVTVATDPPIDPAARGLRVILQEQSGAPLVDAMVPGGPGWTSNARGTAWRYRNPSASEIIAITLGTTRARPERLKFRILGRKATYRASAASYPIIATMVIDAPYATTGQCGEAYFPDAPRRFPG